MKYIGMGCGQIANKSSEVSQNIIGQIQQKPSSKVSLKVVKIIPQSFCLFVMFETQIGKTLRAIQFFPWKKYLVNMTPNLK